MPASDPTTAQRDIAAADEIDAAAAALERALRTIPNHIASAYDADDVRRVDEILRQLRILQMARVEITRARL
jgi:hypothetical protein